jgi:hypothetical protein
MWKLLPFYVVCASILSGCAYMPQDANNPMFVPHPGTPYVLTPENTLAVELAVSSVLKDPSSAQFRTIRAAQLGAKVTVCGEINGKNSYGGYAGFTPFIAFLIPSRNVATLTDMADSGSTEFETHMVNLVTRECGAAGL